MTLVDKIAQPNFDINSLSQEEKIRLVIESDGALVGILEGETIKGSLYLTNCAFLPYLLIFR